jgi:hypothetical protein
MRMNDLLEVTWNSQKPYQLWLPSQSECWDLNPRPPLPQSGALPSCATSRFNRPFILTSILSLLRLDIGLTAIANSKLT